MDANPLSSAWTALPGSGAETMPRAVKSWSVAALAARSTVLGSMSAAAPTPSQAVRSWERESWPLERTSFIRLCGGLLGFFL